MFIIVVPLYMTVILYRRGLAHAAFVLPSIVLCAVVGLEYRFGQVSQLFSRLSVVCLLVCVPCCSSLWVTQIPLHLVCHDD